MASKTVEKRKRPPVYPTRRRISLMTFLKSSDLWMAVYFFVTFQLALMLIALGGLRQDTGFVWTIAGIALGIWVVSHGIMTATNRQMIKLRYDAVNKGRIVKVVLLLFVYIYALSFVMLMLGFPITVQPNQEALNVIMEAQKWPMFFMTVLVAPITEELVFREFLPYAGGKSVTAFVIFSVVFAVMHAPAGLTGWLLYGGISLAFLYLRLKGNNLMQAIVAHIAYNLITSVLGML